MDISGLVALGVALVSGIAWLLRLESRVTSIATARTIEREETMRRLRKIEEENVIRDELAQEAAAEIIRALNDAANSE